MENKEFGRFAQAWNKAGPNSRAQKMYSEKDIKDIKMKNSLDFSTSINKSIVFDYVIKSILITVHRFIRHLYFLSADLCYHI